MAHKTNESTSDMRGTKTAPLTVGPQPAQKADGSGVGDGKSGVPILTEVEDHKGHGKRTESAPSPIKKARGNSGGQEHSGQQQEEVQEGIQSKEGSGVQVLQAEATGKSTTDTHEGLKENKDSQEERKGEQKPGDGQPEQKEGEEAGDEVKENEEDKKSEDKESEQEE